MNKEDTNPQRIVDYGCNHCANPAHFTTLTGNRTIEPNENGEILWHICNFTDDLEKYKILFAIEQAFKVWQPHFFPIEIKPTANFDDAHIKLFFVEGNHKETEIRIEDGRLIKIDCSYPFDGKGGVLAHAFAPYGGHLAGHLHLDDAELWADMHKPNFKTDLLTVLIHEIGHNWNLGHSKFPDAIMFPTYNGIKRNVHADDIAGVNFLYADAKKRVAKMKGLPTGDEPVVVDDEPIDDDLPVQSPPPEKRSHAREFFAALLLFVVVFIVVYFGNL